MNRILPILAASIIAMTMVQAPGEAKAQWIVFDPNNYVQNVLTAARELQQINNQITSLQRTKRRC
ncbi:P-type conjugative transfer protein TrbJ [Bradyrhizobium sp. LM6.11]